MKGRKHHAEGGKADFDEDLKDKPKRYNESKVEDEAEERKRGGRAKRRTGGMVHREEPGNLKYAKSVGKIEGERNVGRADRKPRKSGGRTGCDSSPLSSAHAGTAPTGHKTTDID
jgi:hypothetical protein